jgi:magnesium transporter
MITYYYKNLRSKQVSQLDEYHPGSWVYVQSPTEDELAFLVKRFKLEPGHLEDAMDEDEMPRLEKEGDKSYIFMRYAYTTDDLELTTAPLLFIVGPDILITISHGEIPRMQRFVKGKVEFATTQRAKLVLQILYQIVDEYEIFINNISRQTKMIRSRLRGHEIGNQDFVDFVLIEDELNEFLSALQPTTAILRRLLLGKHMQLYEEDQDLVEDLLLNNEQSIESCNANIKTIINIREAYSTINSNNLNRSMKVLTAFTVLITLPNVIYGMYGMNIPLPFQHEPWAFAFVFPLSLLLSWLVFVVAKKRRIF